MSNIEINKEGLFSMVKRITQENSSIVNKFPIKSSQYTTQILIPNLISKRINVSPKIANREISPKLPTRKTTIFKNKFLERNNIQINEQNVLHLLSERRKKKLADSKTIRNNDNNYINKILKGKTVEINLDENKMKYNNNKEKRTIKNSNSENFENKSFNKNPNLNMDSLIKNSKSFFKILEKNNNNSRINKSNINNNININININGDINNNKKIKNLFKANKRIINYYPTQGNNTEINLDKANNNNNNKNELSYNNLLSKNKKEIYQEKIKKSNHKRFYLNNINKFEEEEENLNNINEPKDKKEMEHNNTVNINLNFISNPNNKRINTHSNISHLNINRRKNIIISPDQKNNNNINKNINIRHSSNINYIKSPRLKDLFSNSNNNINNAKDIINNRQIKYSIKKSNTESIYELNNEEIKNKKDIIQIEDLLILEGKFCHLLDCLNYENPLPKMCIEWWNFYTYSSYFGKFPKLFPKLIKNKKIISDYQIAQDTILFELLSIIFAYEILKENFLRKSLINNLMVLINEIHQNFLVECDYILSKISNKSLSNLWIKKLKNLILSKKTWNLYNNHLNLLHQRNIIVHNSIKYLINICSNIIEKNRDININIDLDTISYFNNNIQNITLIELSEYFSSEISKENLKINRAFKYIIKKNNINKINFNNLVIIPYLPIKTSKDKNQYTLVLDLDETLISFRINQGGKGILKMRPGLFKFLKKVKTKYELVVFTAGTKEYADPIIDIIEQKEKFFIKRLFRQHTIYRDNIYIKDLTKLGRDLSKIIIVDNMPQNFCLQKENGILISNYFGQDNGDNTLYLLGDILLKIAQNPGKDVRNEIKKYKEEIFTKITTNLDS